MNIGKQGLKQSVRVKLKEGYRLKVTGVLVIFLSQDGFEKDCPERKS